MPPPPLLPASQIKPRWNCKAWITGSCTQSTSAPKKRGNVVFTFGVCWADYTVVSFSSLGALFCCQFIFFWATLRRSSQSGRANGWVFGCCGRARIWSWRSRRDSDPRCWGEAVNSLNLLVILRLLVWRNKDFDRNWGGLMGSSFFVGDMVWKGAEVEKMGLPKCGTVPRVYLFSRACVSCQKLTCFPPRLRFFLTWWPAIHSPTQTQWDSN